MNHHPNDPKGEAGSKKCPLGLVPPYAMQETAWVHKLGSTKYGPFNWRDSGVCASTYVHAILRHLNAWRDGEDLDPESGRSHIAHVACCCNILLDAANCGKLVDDRSIPPNKKRVDTVEVVCRSCGEQAEYNYIRGSICDECVGPDTPY
jgi:hypothetical protein